VLNHSFRTVKSQLEDKREIRQKKEGRDSQQGSNPRKRLEKSEDGLERTQQRNHPPMVIPLLPWLHVTGLGSVGTAKRVIEGKNPRKRGKVRERNSEA